LPTLALDNFIKYGGNYEFEGSGVAQQDASILNITFSFPLCRFFFR
jgi:hypothetical protein